jgi:hypothetical protein
MGIYSAAVWIGDRDRLPIASRAIILSPGAGVNDRVFAAVIIGA